MISSSGGKKSDGKKQTKDKVTTKSHADAPGKSSTLNKADSTIKRTMSFQNVQCAQNPVLTSTGLLSTGSLRVPVKRAQSSQNVCSPKTAGKQSLKLSTPVNAMAYNAELLANFEKEKKSLERRISELIQTAENRQRDNEKLKYEVKNLKEKLREARTLLKDHQNQQPPPLHQVLSPDSAYAEEVAQLKRENSYLKQRLSELNVCLDEHFTDAEKLLMKKSKDARSDHDESSAPGSAVKNRSPSDIDSKEAECPEFGSERRSNYSLDCNCWDRQSTKSSEGALSEMSVACLQDRILQMEETHYSTNEELQATLQELTDLQDAVNELTSENERLANERNVLLESLCTQTLKLENTRLHLNFVKSLLLRDAELGGMEMSDVEKQLLALIKSDQEEREELLLRQVELSNKLQAMGRDNQDAQESIEGLQVKIQSLQKEVDDASHNNIELEEQNVLLVEQLCHARLEHEKCKIVLESEQKKILEMEQERRLLLEKSELSTVVDLLREEKEKLEHKVITLEQELSEKRFETMHLKESCASLEEELRLSTSRADAKLEEKCSELEGQLQRSRSQTKELEEELKVVHQHLDSMRLECDQHLDEKKTHTLTLARAESELRTWRSKASRAQTELKELQMRFGKEQEEWLQFQEDLQRAVVIANEFKTEAQNDAEKVAADYKRMQETVQILTKQLEMSKNEVEHLKQQLASLQNQKEQQEQAAGIQKSLSMEPSPPSVLISREEIRDKVLSSFDRELASRRQVKQQNNQKLSVRHLISSIEEQMKNDSTSALLGVTSPTHASGKFGPPSGIRTGLRKEEEEHASKTADSPPGTPMKLMKRGSDLNASTGNDMNSLSSQNHQHFQAFNLDILQAPTATDDAKLAVVDSVTSVDGARKPLVGILTNKPKKNEGNEGSPEKTSSLSYLSKTDPLANLAKQLGGSKRNALLKWCQNKTTSYKDIDITNFSSSWNDGLAFCALLHTYMPDKIPYKDLNPQDKMRNFTIAFKGAESVGISQTLNIIEMASRERPDWQAVMAYVTSIYKHFELTN